MTFALAVFTLVGHAFLWIGMINRLHAIHIPRRIIDRLTETSHVFNLRECITLRDKLSPDA